MHNVISLFEVDAIGDDDDLSHVYLLNFKQLWLGFCEKNGYNGFSTQF